MKRFHMLTILLAIILSVPASGQVTIDTTALIGSWKYTKDAANITITFKEDHSYHNKIFVEVEDIDGALSITWDGTWKTEADTIIQQMDATTLKVKYIGENKAIGQQVEQMMSANKEMLMQATGTKDTEIKMCNVVLADDILTYRPKWADKDMLGKEDSESIVMHRMK